MQRFPDDGENVEGNNGCSSLLDMATLALADHHDLYPHFDCLPFPSAQAILETIRARGQLSLQTLLKFSRVDLDLLDLASCRVTDEWMALIASMPLTSLNLSNNPAVTDEGLSIFVGVSKPQSCRRTPVRPPSSGGASASEKKRRRAGGKRSGSGTPTASSGSKPLSKSHSAEEIDVPRTPPASPGPGLYKSYSESVLLSEDCAGCSLSVSPSPSHSWCNSPRGSWGTPSASSLWPRGGEVYVLGEATRSVVELVLTGTSITNAGLALLLHLPHLRTLEVCGTDRVGNSGVQSLTECQALEELRLRYLPKLSTGVQALAKLQGLCVLDLQGCAKLTDLCLEPLLAGSLPLLRRLDLSLCPKISPALLLSIARCKSIRELDLTGSGASGERSSSGGAGVKAVPEMRGLGRLALARLQLSDCLLDPAQLAPLASTLAHLSLYRCNFCACARCQLRHAYGGECHMASLGAVLAQFSLLQSLSLVKCRLAEGSLPLPLIASLRSLNLTDSQVPDLSVDKLLKWGRRLESLNASGWVDGQSEEGGEVDGVAGGQKLGDGLVEDAGFGTGDSHVGQRLARLELGRVCGEMVALQQASAFMLLGWLDLKGSVVANKDLASLSALTTLRGIDLSFCANVTSQALKFLPACLTTLYAKTLRLGVAPAHWRSRRGPRHSGSEDSVGSSEEEWRSEDGVFEMTEDEEDEDEAAEGSSTSGDVGAEERGGKPEAEERESVEGYLMALRRLTKLEELDMSGSEVTVKALSGTDGKNLPPSLRKLHLNGCLKLSHGLPEAIPGALTHLQLNGCLAITDGVVEGVAAKCQQLREFGVVGVPVGDNAATAIASLRRLQVLGIRADTNSMLTDHGRATLYSMPATVILVGGASGWSKD